MAGMRSRRGMKIAGIAVGALAIGGFVNYMGAMTFINSLSLVAVLIIAALGLTIIFGIMKICNFAHGEFMMLGAYVAFFITSTTGSRESFFFALPAAFIFVGIVGLLLEFAVLRWLYESGLFIPPMLATWALGIIMTEAVSLVFGRQFQVVPLPIITQINFLGVNLPGFSTLIFVVSGVVFLLIFLLYAKTSFGAKSRATAEDRVMAEALGINIRSIYRWSMALGAGLAGLAGALLSPLISVHPVMGTMLLVRSFFVVIVGGVGKIIATLVGGNVMGWSEQLTASLLTAPGFPTLVVAQAFVFVLAGVLFLLRPQGIVGSARERLD